MLCVCVLCVLCCVCVCCVLCVCVLCVGGDVSSMVVESESPANTGVLYVV